MILVEIAIGTVLRIPEGWDVFTYRGWVYRKTGKVGVPAFQREDVLQTGEK